MKKLFTSIFALVLSIFVFPNISFATPDCHGYAIYRDGVGGLWHTGIMDESYCDDYLPVLHHPGSPEVVQWDSWENFLGGNTFQGVYKPIGEVLNSYDQDMFVAMGRVLRTENIDYTLLSQLDYDVDGSSAWVYPEDVISMRCDGVVEYIYEWYGFRVYGSDENWDITKHDYWNRLHHSAASITPVSQKNYLSFVIGYEPTRPSY